MTISVEVSVNVSNSVLNTSMRTRTCASCGWLYENCLMCTNISCLSCKENYVMDFDRTCKVACSQGYINLNNTGYCIRC